jgi:hypothetical protein
MTRIRADNHDVGQLALSARIRAICGSKFFLITAEVRAVSICGSVFVTDAHRITDFRCILTYPFDCHDNLCQILFRSEQHRMVQG